MSDRFRAFNGNDVEVKDYECDANTHLLVECDFEGNPFRLVAAAEGVVYWEQVIEELNKMSSELMMLRYATLTASKSLENVLCREGNEIEDLLEATAKSNAVLVKYGYRSKKPAINDENVVEVENVDASVNTNTEAPIAAIEVVDDTSNSSDNTGRPN